MENTMRGSEKQIAWAEDLKEGAIKALEWAREHPIEEAKTMPERWNEMIDQMEARINNAQHAAYIIDAFKHINFSAKSGEDAAAAVAHALSGRVTTCKL